MRLRLEIQWFPDAIQDDSEKVQVPWVYMPSFQLMVAVHHE